MRRALIAAGVSLLAGAIGFGAAASSEDLPPGPPAARNPDVPSMPRDTGAGELLHLVVGGTYATREEAETANAATTFGDLQGYYVVPVAQFRGLQARLPLDGEWALASAFRTRAGAQEFAELAAAAGAPAFVTERVVSSGGAYAGLGQERAPDGTGPLTHPIPASMP